MQEKLSLKDIIGSLVFPEPCKLCGEPFTPSEHPGVCFFCARPSRSHRCLRCGAPTHEEVRRCSNCINRTIFYDTVAYPGVYSGGYAHIIAKAKEKPNSPYGYHLLSLLEESFPKLLKLAYEPKPSEEGKERLESPKIILTFVPPDPIRRGLSPYLPEFIWKNTPSKKVLRRIQSESHGSDGAAEKIIRKKLLRKTKSTPPQKELSRRERLTNLKGVFQATGKLKGETIILIDDIATTGSTLNEASKVLKEAGASRVLCLVAAFARSQRI